ncbi:MAG: phosphoribosylamine--glycine ligase [Armatimonadetes bacterium]|nr:phosphoribosylamine--glycine ligase [Armatimonadota bacterium]
MRILVVGSGGREHALVWALRRSPAVREVYCAPGNPGMKEASCLPVGAGDVAALVRAATDLRPDLVVVGPEEPLARGVVDGLEAAGVRAFGPTQRAARIESSKVYAKQLLARAGVPQPDHRTFDSAEEALRWVRQLGGRCVVKADGLAGGKGALVCQDVREAEDAVRSLMVEGRFGEAGRRVVVEEYLEGEEASALAFVDGEVVVPMVLAQDHKRLLDGDRGPNTGGMGAVAPLAHLPGSLTEQVTREILQPTAKALCDDGAPFRGVLYAGLMLTREGPRVLEFNARFGDPEAQVLLPLLESDLTEVLVAACTGRLEDVRLRWRPGAAVCVVAAARGYPEAPQTGQEVRGLDKPLPPASLVFCAGVARRDGKMVTAGGRVLNAVGLGADVRQAREAAYRVLEHVRFDGMHYRTDIGLRALRAVGAER